MSQDAKPNYGTRHDERSTAELMGDLSGQLKRLVRDEMQSAVIELRSKGKKMGTGAGLFGGAGLLAFFGAGVLIATLVMLLALVMTPWIAGLVVGAALLLAAGLFAMVGRDKTRRATPPVPEQTMSSVRDDIGTIKGGAHR
ncbi:phage holin family protein [Actinoalloteichus hymeniacidonis]|uniref:DUF1469 family protein n=1 Tax=Actinoalloteichus hymeniacidonis TaxID=340345 RepID=A0AAC9HTZ5_9PSEU|nr:phage holin family protein [Actinoalloteichus hymeniacidonis]AOS64866.1 putative DUF1469 family protein [Actinoalloteichus hymeniacidonis]MBB5907059.1 hypothetical protein [Actinoalloteichus hymeniacidonis]